MITAIPVSTSTPRAPSRMRLGLKAPMRPKRADRPTRCRPEPVQRAAGTGIIIDVPSDIQIRHAQRILLNELPAGLNDVAHQLDEDIIGLGGLLDPDLQ